MPPPLEPPRLADLIDLAERPLADDWSLRAALCRYAQPQPVRASQVLSIVRRLEAALGEHLDDLRTDGPALLAQAEAVGSEESDADGPNGSGEVVGLLVAAIELDDLATTVAEWAVERAGERPDRQIDEVVERLTARLAELDVPEEAPPPRAMRGRG